MKHGSFGKAQQGAEFDAEMAEPETPVLRVENLTVVKETGEAVLQGMSFVVGSGETFGLLGESSAGKTTLAKAILRVLPEGLQRVGGKIFLGATEITELPEEKMRGFWGRKMSYLPQNAGSALNPVFRLRSQLEEVARTRTSDKVEQRVLMEKALQQVQLPTDGKFLRKYPFQLSGGQQQRFLLAELLLAGPELLIADEPTSSLDMPLQQEIVNLLQAVREKLGVAILFISHDLAVVEKLADRIGVLFEGKLVEVQKTEDLIENPQHPYTQQLVALHRSFAL